MKPLGSDPVPPGPVTLTAAAPALPVGVVPVIVESLTTTKFATALPPMLAPVAPAKPDPEIVMASPPAVVPVEGLTEVTEGVAATAA